MYLSFKQWVNEPHSQWEVQKSKTLLGNLITLIKLCVPRTDGNGWNIPKMHALAKMPKNMLKFGSANNAVCPKGQFTLNMSTTNTSGMGVLPDEVMWHCAKKERLKCGVSDLLTFALRRHSHINSYSDLYKVTGYTLLTINCRDTEERVI